MSGIDVRRYSCRVLWSPEDDEYVATVLEFPSLSWLDEDRAAALKSLIEIAAELTFGPHHGNSEIVLSPLPRTYDIDY